MHGKQMQTIGGRVLVSLTLLTLTLGSSRVFSAEENAAVKQSTDSYHSANRKIRVTRFEPAKRGIYPAVVLIHGVDGVNKKSEKSYNALAGVLVNNGYIVFIVHYFDAFADRPKELAFFQENLKDFLHPTVGAKWERLKQTCDECLATVNDGVRHIRTQPGVDQERIGLVGFSLGGFVAMSAATEKEFKIAAVVNLFGGLLEDLHPRVKALPVVLSVYGEKDQLVPVATAHHLHMLLEGNSVADEMTVYPNIGHMFENARGELSLWDVLDAQQRATAFLEKHVKSAKQNKIATR